MKGWAKNEKWQENIVTGWKKYRRGRKLMKLATIEGRQKEYRKWYKMKNVQRTNDVEVAAKKGYVAVKIYELLSQNCYRKKFW